MTAQVLLSDRGMTSILLILSNVLTLIGVVLWVGTNMWQWPTADIANYLAWERGMILAGIVVLMLGLMLLEGMLRMAGDLVVARVALGTYFVAGILGVVGETYEISRQQSFAAAIVVYVVLALLGQAAFGVSLLRTGLLSAWIGWVTVGWNMFWLVVLPIASPGDIYYPILHYPMPLLIGIALLVIRHADSEIHQLNP